MLRITWTKNGELVFKVSGRMDVEDVDDLKALFTSDFDVRARPVDV